MTERRGDETGRLLNHQPAMAAANGSCPPLPIADGLAHGDVMSVPHARAEVIVAEPEQDADALRRGEGQVEPGDASSARRRPQLHSGLRIEPFKHAPESIRLDLAAQPELAS